MAIIAEGQDPEGPGLAERLGRRASVNSAGCSRLIWAPVPRPSCRRAAICSPGKLVVETDLPLTEVALAAGFESLRRFNHVFKTLYGQPRRAACGALPPARATDAD